MCYICSVYCLCIRPLVLSFLIWTNLVFGLMPPLHSPCLLFFSWFFFLFVMSSLMLPHLCLSCAISSGLFSSLSPVLVHIRWHIAFLLPSVPWGPQCAVCIVWLLLALWIAGTALPVPISLPSNSLTTPANSTQSEPAANACPRYISLCLQSVSHRGAHSQTHTCYLCAWSYVVGRLGGFALVRYG